MGCLIQKGVPTHGNRNANTGLRRLPSPLWGFGISFGIGFPGADAARLHAVAPSGQNSTGDREVDEWIRGWRQPPLTA